MTAPFTHGTPELIAKAKAASCYFVGLAGRGATAPGAVVVRKLDHNTLHPFVVHFANTQLGGYHGGDYCETIEEAITVASERVRRYDPYNDLRNAFNANEREDD